MQRAVKPDTIAWIDNVSGDGAPIGWFARQVNTATDDHQVVKRVRAVFLGHTGLAIAEPIGQRHMARLPWKLQLLHEERLSQSPKTQPRPNPGNGDLVLRDVQEANIPGLSQEAKTQLGNLPDRAQIFMQKPFLRGEQVERFEYHYEAYTDRYGHAGNTPVYVQIIAGQRFLTAVVGSNTCSSPGATRQWNLTGYRFKVITRPRPQVPLTAAAPPRATLTNRMSEFKQMVARKQTELSGD